MASKIDYGTVVFGGEAITLTTEANHMCCPTPGRTNMWSARGTRANGDVVDVVWDFADAEIEAAGEDASNLPWDDAHVCEVHAR